MKEVKRCVEEVGVGFMMSSNYHPAMKMVSPVRKSLRVKTVFNILGPMLNPARVPFAVVGVYHEDLVSAFNVSREFKLSSFLNMLKIRSFNLNGTL